MPRFFTSESVTEGHPDKICDQISDAILDDILAHDPNGRVACETVVTTGLCFVFGEITTSHYVDVQKIVREKVAEIGYTRGKFGFDAENLAVMTAIDPQSPDIAMGVDETSSHEQGAGDQGIMFGYACDETDVYMPMAITLAHRLAKRLTDVRKNGTIPYLRPDGKTQVTVEYDDNGKIFRVDTVLISTQHSPEVDMEVLARDVKANVVDPIIPANLIDENTKLLFNPLVDLLLEVLKETQVLQDVRLLLIHMVVLHVMEVEHSLVRIHLRLIEVLHIWQDILLKMLLHLVLLHAVRFNYHMQLVLLNQQVFWLIPLVQLKFLRH